MGTPWWWTLNVMPRVLQRAKEGDVMMEEAEVRGGRLGDTVLLAVKGRRSRSKRCEGPRGWKEGAEICPQSLG